MNNAEYIKKHMTKPQKIYQGRWCASFTCKDGYSYSAESDSKFSVAKKEIYEKICYLANLGKHPIQ